MTSNLQNNDMAGLSVVAMGGHSLLDPHQSPALENQFAVTAEAMKPIAELIARGERLVLTHGNGPQVGFLKRRSELASPEVHEVPLDSLVADTQGALGFMMQRTLRLALENIGSNAAVASVVTEVEVSADDPAFQHPTKPIGRFYTEEEAHSFEKERGWKMVEDSGRGWRRVVPSPLPKVVVQLDAVKALIDAGITVITCGGGGIPVSPDSTGERQGLEAVIDKDRASQILATALGAKRLFITTGVDRVYKGFRSENPVALDVVKLSELKELYAQKEFPAGSMGPKVEAAIDFLEGGGEACIICKPEHLADAFAGHAGTTIVRD